MLFKVDFEKAFDSIHWDYIFSMLHFLGFDDKWVSWIKACLVSSKASLLLNGSPSAEFSIERGLRQGDPLSPFLFIIGMEGLNAAIKDAMDASLFHGSKVGSSSNQAIVSHCLFADDALFVGEWTDDNAENLISILCCFFAVSGLKINFQKSSLFGIGVNPIELERVAGIMNCSPANIPFTFLGLPVGQNMRRIDSWSPIIAKTRKRLDSWKVNLLSSGARLTLVKSVLGSIGTYFFSLFKAPVAVVNKLESLRAQFFWGGKESKRKTHWISWRTILNPLDHGGLGVPSLKALNLAMIYKWRWRFVTNKDASWANTMVAIHGACEGNSLPCNERAAGTWVTICKTIQEIHQNNLIDSSSLRLCLGNGSCSFWKDPWLGNISLASRFKRLQRLDANCEDSVAAKMGVDGWVWSWRRDLRGGAEESQFVELLTSIQGSHLSNDNDQWLFDSFPDSTFTVSHARKMIDKMDFTQFTYPTLWCKYVPTKINIFIWKLRVHRLPTTMNLLDKGLNFPSLECALCNVSEEDEDHLFVRCDTSFQVWCKIGSWIQTSIPIWDSTDDIWPWIDTQPWNTPRRLIVRVIVIATLWNIWRLRNSLVFKERNIRKSHVFDNILLDGFNWLFSRYKKGRISWNMWLQDPLNAL